MPSSEQWIRSLAPYFVISLIVLGAAGLGYAFVALFFVSRTADPALPGIPDAPAAVTILRPLHGDEPGLVDAIRSVFDHGHGAPVQIIFGAADADDPALLAIEQARLGYPRLDVSVVINPQAHGANKKVSNLVNMEPLIRHPVVMIIDSDVTVPRGAVSALAARVADPAVGVGSSLHAGIAKVGFWSRLAAMDITYRFMPSVLVGRGLHLAEPVLGPMMGLRRETLARIGGFSAFADVLADDYEIGRAVRRLGLRVELCGPFVGHGCSDQGLPALLRHELRWTRTIYGIDPAGFAGSIVTHVTPIALLAVLVSGGAMAAWLLLLAALGVRSAIKLRLDRLAPVVSGPLWLLPLRDCLSLAVWLLTFFVGKVDWRGYRLEVTADGRLMQGRQI